MHIDSRDRQESLYPASVSKRTQQMVRYRTKYVQLWILIDCVVGLKIRRSHASTGIGTRRHRFFCLSDDGDRHVRNLGPDQVQDF